MKTNLPNIECDCFTLAEMPKNYTGVCFLLDFSYLEYIVNRVPHRLDGPAVYVLDVHEDGTYEILHRYHYIRGLFQDAESVQNRPEFIQNKLNRILEEQG